MLTPVGLLPSELAQLLFMSVLVAFSVLVGQSLYEYANKYDKRVERKIKNRKHPDIRYVLYDILWPPSTLLVVFVLLRIGLEALPPGSVSNTLTILMDILLFLAFLWFAIRTVKTVMALADTTTEKSAAEA